MKAYYLSLLMVFAGFFGASFSRKALADDVLYQANFCAGTDQRVAHLPEGVGNDSLVGYEAVHCPFILPFDGRLVVNEVDVTVFAVNPSTPLICTLNGLALDSTVLWSDTQSTNFASTNAQFLVFRENQPTLGTLNMTCFIPPLPPLDQSLPGLRESIVTTYRLITSFSGGR